MQTTRAVFLTLALAAIAGPVLGADEPSLVAGPKGAVLAGQKLRLEIELRGVDGGPVEAAVEVDGEPAATVPLEPGKQEVAIPGLPIGTGAHEIRVVAAGASSTFTARAIPAWLSIVPPLVAILLALLFKEVLLALFLGILGGAFLLAHFDPAAAFARTIDTFVRDALADADHASILIFSSLLGGMVGVITKSGGTLGIVTWLARYATDGRRGQIATWLMGIFIFFDDYANTLIVGSTMRPVTDRLRISREKLAYLVDSTAAPVVCIAPISTWVGYEVGLIDQAIERVSFAGEAPSAYEIFIFSIPYSFYPIFALVLGLTIAVTRRDRGPMLRAERRARETGRVVAEGDVPLSDFGGDDVAPVEGSPLRARNALIPILTVIGMTVLGLYVTGSAENAREDFPGTFAYLRQVFSDADPYAALLWASLSGALVAIGLTVLQPKLGIRDTMTALSAGFKSMLLALVVLVLAWALGSVCESLHTADFLVSITEGVLSPVWIPALVFLIAAAVAFATGTSWATMAILMPLVIPMVVELSASSGAPIDALDPILLGAVAAVLAGAVWGDHCSPISDTTILSSMASGCDHVAHVRTQAPYALVAGAVGVIVGNLGTALGLPVWLALPIGAAVVVLAVLRLGTRVEEPPA